MRRRVSIYLRWLATVAAAWLVFSIPVAANDPVATSAQCDFAAQRAAQSSGVPVAVLSAIARVETGRSVDGVLSPWPWTVNQAGDGSFFDSIEDATAHVQTAIDAGETNIDIGCFQINLHWHSKAFASLEDMFDPDQNAQYAASYLTRLQEEHGSWEGAIGAYHSRKDARAEAYLEKVTAVIATPTPDLTTYAEAVPVARDNRYPLLRGGGGQANGSLVATDTEFNPIPLLR